MPARGGAGNGAPQETPQAPAASTRRGGETGAPQETPPGSRSQDGGASREASRGGGPEGAAPACSEAPLLSAPPPPDLVFRAPPDHPPANSAAPEQLRPLLELPLGHRRRLLRRFGRASSCRPENAREEQIRVARCRRPWPVRGAPPSRSEVTTVSRSHALDALPRPGGDEIVGLVGGRESATSTRPAALVVAALVAAVEDHQGTVRPPSPPPTRAGWTSLSRDSRRVRSAPGLSVGERRMRLYPSTRIRRDSLIAAPPWPAAVRSAPAQRGVDDGARGPHRPAALRVHEVHRIQLPAGVRDLRRPAQAAVFGLEHRPGGVEPHRITGLAHRSGNGARADRHRTPRLSICHSGWPLTSVVNGAAPWASTAQAAKVLRRATARSVALVTEGEIRPTSRRRRSCPRCRRRRRPPSPRACSTTGDAAGA